MPTHPLYGVTDEERREYGELCEHARRQLVRQTPETLWYYTSAATFARIIDTATVWSTQISCLNDHTEFRHAVQLVREAIEPFAELPHDDDTRWIAAYVHEQLGFDAATFSFFYVFCLSEEKDHLSQWRAYADGENGVSIGFRGELARPDTVHPALLMPVTYVEDTKTGLAADIAKWTIQFFKRGLARRPGAEREKWAASFLPEWQNYVIYFAPILKDSAFKDEHEWRLILSLSEEDRPKLQIQQRRSLISTHLPLSFGDKLPIKRVVVGPCRHPRVSLVSVGSYLTARGYKVSDEVHFTGKEIIVESSKVPFQTT
jgi:hypothetical protein